MKALLLLVSSVVCRGWVTPSVTRGVSHCGLAIYIKNDLKAKEDGNSNISQCKNIIFKKSSKRNQKSFKIL
jgi:hypothetical protein